MNKSMYKGHLNDLAGRTIEGVHHNYERIVIELDQEEYVVLVAVSYDDDLEIDVGGGEEISTLDKREFGWITEEEYKDLQAEEDRKWNERWRERELKELARLKEKYEKGGE